MDLRLDGKTAVVTGASRGIGLAVAREMVQSGARVMLTSRKADALEAACAEIGGDVAWCAANAGDPDATGSAVAATMERFGSIDILVNNAATSPHAGPVIDIALWQMDKIMQVNLRGVMIWTQAVWEASMAARGGVVVNVTSVGGLISDGVLGYYNAVKAGVIHLTRQLAAELAPRVRVNSVAPGLVKTDMARSKWEGREDELGRIRPLGRLGEPSDISPAVVFLASDASSWVTGQTLVVDGGMQVRY
jgi:NAD(P)-dependent dehydrogenase (short-subunit alcohol dehydrogenase family)